MPAAVVPVSDAHLFRSNYEQLGLKFKLYSAEVLFNKGLAQIYLGNYDAGMADLEEASADKVTIEHGVIDEAIQDRGQGYTVFSIVRSIPPRFPKEETYLVFGDSQPVGVLYRPSENKLRNAKQKDYLGKAVSNWSLFSPRTSLITVLFARVEIGCDLGRK